jgi:hypothetical protein
LNDRIRKDLKLYVDEIKEKMNEPKDESVNPTLDSVKHPRNPFNLP